MTTKTKRAQSGLVPGLLAAFALSVAASVTGAAAPATQPAVAKQRDFLFTYAATVTGLAPGQEARVWLPVPPGDEDQRVTVERNDIQAEVTINAEPKYGNRVMSFRAKAKADGTVPLSVTYRVTRHEVRVDAAGSPKPGAGAPDDEEAQLFLRPDALVPVGGKPLSLLAGRTLPEDHMALAQVMYDAVESHMKYSKEGTGWGRGDAEWACDSKFGNCTDFHSLFISLARAKKIPAKFEMGFSVPEKKDGKGGAGDVTGYHCWAKFQPRGRGWVPVDISEADKHPEMKDYYFGRLTPDRVAFSVGRDLVLEPKQDGPPLNFFIYPYVEVDGKPWPAEKVTKRFGYQDVETSPGAR